MKDCSFSTKRNCTPCSLSERH